MRRLFAGAFLLAAVVSSVQADDPPQFILKWGSLGSGEGNPPRGIAIALNGTVYVVDTNNNRIQHFDSHGTFLDIWGTGGTAPGEFGVPRGIALDLAENVHIADYDSDRIQKFDGNGTLLAAWGYRGSGN